jgi:hypothetical protein
MKSISRYTTLLGFVSWLVPFAVSFFFVDRTGQFIIPQLLFKSLMVVIFGGLGTALLVVAFRRVTPSAQSGLALGCYWLAINLVLDFAILVPLVQMPVTTYIFDIGLRYLLIPIISTAIGIVAQREQAAKISAAGS